MAVQSFPGLPSFLFSTLAAATAADMGSIRNLLDPLHILPRLIFEPGEEYYVVLSMVKQKIGGVKTKHALTTTTIIINKSYYYEQ